MAKVQKRTFSLAEDQSDYIDAKVAMGGYASSSEVVREGLRALQQRDAALDRWLIKQVLPVAQELDEFPDNAVPIEDAFRRIDASINDAEAKKAS
ncbi:antitoxin ParD1/3/4 [Devosia sp. YR412]|uniref:ribbon-helix-helix domain-containing protein n=1 Tax=Devosia sp. YR412 TaxID=1881030 RepID=UPI0008D36067|nr:type II toxin-antitoxin system ParD family antitoxin [Devosia sp. YR412]SEQ39285.1 antitoxin ParD1/3/4 [Devosia sp. YR412]